MSQPQDIDPPTHSDRLEDKIDWLIEADATTRRELGRLRYYLLALAVVSIGLAVWIVVLNARYQAEITNRIEQTGQETADTVLRNLPIFEVPSNINRPLPEPAVQMPPDLPPQPETTPASPRAPGFQPFDLRAPPQR